MTDPNPRTAPVERPGASSGDEGQLLPVTTLVLWLGCLSVGVVGLTISYARLATPKPAPTPVHAEFLQVELTRDPVLSTPAVPDKPSSPPQTVALVQPPALSPAPTVPKAPAMAALVARPDPAMAFALPVEGSTTIAAAKDAGFARTAPSGGTGPSVPVQTLSYGRGEGKQPAPEYPSKAMREGQEGVVGVRFSVGTNGRVLAAEVVTPSPWPLLDQSALKAVREKWRFQTGAIRYYEVSIRFELKK